MYVPEGQRDTSPPPASLDDELVGAGRGVEEEAVDEGGGRDVGRVDDAVGAVHGCLVGQVVEDHRAPATVPPPRGRRQRHEGKDVAHVHRSSTDSLLNMGCFSRIRVTFCVSVSEKLSCTRPARGLVLQSCILLRSSNHSAGVESVEAASTATCYSPRYYPRWLERERLGQSEEGEQPVRPMGERSCISLFPPTNSGFAPG